MSTILDGGHGHTSFGHNSKFGPPTGYRPFHSNLDQQCQNIADVYVVFFLYQINPACNLHNQYE
jgi:hypothetical protein